MYINPSYVQRGSSHVDWCEENYQVSYNVAEFWNTVSSIIYMLYSCVVMHHFIPYSHHVNRAVNLVWSVALVLGLASAYCHATLSLAGQIMDELSILWVLIAAYGNFYPGYLVPTWMKSHNTRRDCRYKFRVCCCVFTLIVTPLCIVNPIIKLTFLYMLGLITLLLHTVVTRRSSNAQVRVVGYQSTVYGCVALLCWAGDFLYCETATWQFTYLHTLWHLFGCHGIFSGVMVHAHQEASRQVPHLRPRIAYWPRDHWPWGVAYVKLDRAGTAKCGGDSDFCHTNEKLRKIKYE